MKTTALIHAPQSHTKNIKPFVIFSLILLLCIVWSIYVGAVPITWQDWSAILHTKDQSLMGSAYILWNLRLPRIVLALVVGAALALSGTLTQGLFRNPLADPGLLGVTAGAACVAALTIVFLAHLPITIPPALKYWILPISAFCGAVITCLVLDFIARWLTARSIIGLLLTGIAINALAAAIIGLCTYLATDEQLRNLSFWTLGSLSSANWLIDAIILVALIVICFRVKQLINAMNALALGEAAATHVGVDIKKIRTQVVIMVAILCGLSVAWCGMIGFVSLIAPHLVRQMMGADHRRVIPISMLVGAILLLASDTIARTIAIPAEIPVGIFTSILGAPFFMILLSKFRKMNGV